MRHYPNLGVMLGTVDREGLAALRSSMKGPGDILAAPVLRPIRPVAKAAASLSTKTTWGIRRLRVAELWKQGLTGRGVLVGHLDTGVDGKHLALKGVIAEFAEFDLLGRPVPGNPKPHDTEDHGTHTAATIAGRPVKGRHVGVAYGCQLASAIVIEGGDVIARMLGGMDWALGAGARILSMSLDLPGWRAQFQPITQLIRQRGVLPMFAVGNEGPGTSRSPGNYPEAVSIGASDSQDDVADLSSSQVFNRKRDPRVPDIVAPGAGVISAMPGGGYQSMDGTSMATPHIAGLAALLIEAKPAVTVDQLEKAIFGSAKLAPGMPPDRGNRGVPDAVEALKLL